ncbi:MAG: hypothetical protein AABW56_04295 [Nanoarchaeota archaeon]
MGINNNFEILDLIGMGLWANNVTAVLDGKLSINSDIKKRTLEEAITYFNYDFGNMNEIIKLKPEFLNFSLEEYKEKLVKFRKTLSSLMISDTGNLEIRNELSEYFRNLTEKILNKVCGYRQI